MIQEEQFIGKFDTSNYTIQKQYIGTQVTQILLYHTKYSPPNAKYSIIIVHGFGEHSSRFKYVADFFAKNQFQVLMVDLRGFGYSGGARGCAQVRQLQNDLIILINRAKSTLPLFIYGHSLGGLVTIKLLLEKSDINVSGCIITSPLFGLSKNLHIGWLKKQFVHYLGNHLSDFIVNSQVNPTALTKKTKYMHTLFQDRLILPFLSVKMTKHILDAIDYVKKKGNEFRYPIIIFHGKQDTVTDPQLSRNFVQGHKRSFKQLHIFKNGYHELQHDDERDELLKLSLDFIKKIQNPKNFGVIKVHTIPKNYKKKKPIIKIIIILIIILGLIKKFKIISKWIPQ